ncbi:S1 RNA-binding domain-containing protein [Candidatus Berkelbacteria bacterium]|nr:S1 RNA-binding domain-containing protein [Candidatus Berkelbacteria bacterium]
MSTLVQTMDSLAEELGEKLISIKQGITIKGIVVSVSRARIIVDLDGMALGLIPAREFSSLVSNIKIGDEISSYVLLAENDDGYAILSLRRADKERHLVSLQENYDAKMPVTILVKDTNRGGLVVEYGNIEGFLPVSQLASQHQPRGRKDDIRDALKTLIGKELSAKVITLDAKNNKIVFSEKAAGDSLAEERASQLKIGEEIEGAVTGIVDFGIFVNIGELEGLVHISEISWDRVDNLDRLYKVGDKVRVQVISIEGGRVSLSVKRLVLDPWQSAIKEFVPGQAITGTVVRISPFGAFIEIAKDVVGLMHISEFGVSVDEGLAGKVKAGDADTFQILSIDTNSRKVSLAYPEDRRPPAAKKAAEDRKLEKAVKKPELVAA